MMHPLLLCGIFALCTHAVLSEDCCGGRLEHPPSGVTPNVKVTKEVFGKTDNKTVHRYTLSATNITVQVLTYGGYLTAVNVPDSKGRMKDIVLGYDNLESYLKTPTLLNPIVGRVANRIANSTFTLNGKTYHLNHPANHAYFHGGTIGWNMKVWNASVLPDGVELTLFSPDGDEHFPGNVQAKVTYRLTPDRGLAVAVTAVTDQATPINVYLHCFFNLAGHNAGQKGLNATRITLHASQYYPTDNDRVPYGNIVPVKGTAMDFCTPRPLGEMLANRTYDDIYIMSRCNAPTGQMVKVGSAVHPPSGRTLDMYSDQPHMEFYTAGGHPDPRRTDQASLIGKGGAKYEKDGSFLFITQNFFDKNVKSVPSNILQPGVTYHHNMLFKFGAQ